MKRFSSLAFRNLWSRKVRTLLTGIGIVLGVATVLAFGVTNATVELSLNDFFSQTSGDADLTILDAELDQTFRLRALDQAATYPDVVLAIGSLWKKEIKILLPNDENKTITLVGIEPELDAQVRTYQFLSGRMINKDDRTYTIVLVSTFAEDNDIQLGDVNTMTMNILERIREIGMLRSMGMTRRQIGQMVLAEAGAMGVLGAIFGLVIGLITSEDMVVGMSLGSGWQFDYVFPTAAFFGAAITALLVSQLAAFYPMWRTGRVRIVEAIQHQ